MDEIATNYVKMKMWCVFVRECYKTIENECNISICNISQDDVNHINRNNPEHKNKSYKI